ncbi:MAG: hypothetical protein AAGP08_07105 [Pseudomonadota bacterium]
MLSRLSIITLILAAPSLAAADGHSTLTCTDLSVTENHHALRAFECIGEFQQSLDNLPNVYAPNAHPHDALDQSGDISTLSEDVEATQALFSNLLTLYNSLGETFASKSHEHEAAQTSATMAELVASLETLNARLDRIEDRLDEQPVAAVPSGAVMAFDVLGGCPAGWRTFKPAQGRTLIGAMTGEGLEFGFEENADGSPLTEYKHRAHGGQERVKLTTSQMPDHAHAMLWGRVEEQAGDGDRVGVGNEISTRHPVRRIHSTMSSGQGQPHSNMPPYVALYFCKKT